MRTILLLFHTSNYFNINKDLIDNKYDLFDKVILMNENDLDDNFHTIIKNNIKKYGSRGYGYWIWKPYIILNELEKLDDNDILVYLDLHCNLDNIRFKYNDILLKLKEQPLLVGKLGFNEYMYTTTKLRNHIEKYLDYKFTNEELEEIQYEGGILFIRNCDLSKNFFKQYYEIMLNGFEFISDIHNNDNDNHLTFIENRHDQSVISLLYKYHKYKSPEYLNWKMFH